MKKQEKQEIGGVEGSIYVFAYIFSLVMYAAMIGNVLIAGLAAIRVGFSGLSDNAWKLLIIVLIIKIPVDFCYRKSTEYFLKKQKEWKKIQDKG